MKISKTLTIKQAAALWNDPRADFLERWGEMFDLRLEEITPEHILKYQTDRARESPHAVYLEVRALNTLLKYAGLAEVASPETRK